MTIHTHHFSHEFDQGPPGPARSYWDIRRDGLIVTTVCLHHRKDGQPSLTARGICVAMDMAFVEGGNKRARGILDALGIDQ